MNARPDESASEAEDAPQPSSSDADFPGWRRLLPEAVVERMVKAFSNPCFKQQWWETVELPDGRRRFIPRPYIPCCYGAALDIIAYGQARDVEQENPNGWIKLVAPTLLRALQLTDITAMFDSLLRSTENRFILYTWALWGDPHAIAEIREYLTLDLRARVLLLRKQLSAWNNPAINDRPFLYWDRKLNMIAKTDPSADAESERLAAVIEVMMLAHRHTEVFLLEAFPLVYDPIDPPGAPTAPGLDKSVDTQEHTTLPDPNELHEAGGGGERTRAHAPPVTGAGETLNRPGGPGDDTSEDAGAESALTDEDRKRHSSIPPLDTHSEDWLTAVAAARDERERSVTPPHRGDNPGDVTYLKTARGRKGSIRAEDRTHGIDDAGRMWRRDPGDTQAFWYLKATLRMKPSDSKGQ